MFQYQYILTLLLYNSNVALYMVQLHHHCDTKNINNIKYVLIPTVERRLPATNSVGGTRFSSLRKPIPVFKIACLRIPFIILKFTTFTLLLVAQVDYTSQTKHEANDDCFLPGTIETLLTLSVIFNSIPFILIILKVIITSRQLRPTYNFNLVVWILNVILDGTILFMTAFLIGFLNAILTNLDGNPYQFFLGPFQSSYSAYKDHIVRETAYLWCTFCFTLLSMLYTIIIQKPPEPQIPSTLSAATSAATSLAQAPSSSEQAS